MTHPIFRRTLHPTLILSVALGLLVASSWSATTNAQVPPPAENGSRDAASSDSSTSGEDLLTVAEKSDFTATATYEEVMQLCQELAQSQLVRLQELGHTSQGRSIPLLIIAHDPPQQPSDLAESDKLVALALGNIHAGEVCGKEALLMLAREFTEGQHADVLEQMVLLFAPIYNADGNQPLSVKNRPHQHGPDGGVGQRANGQGLDLNRDHVKLASPETQGFARLLSTWDPALVIDTHTTNGSYHRYALTYDGPRNAAAPEELITYMRDDFLPAVGGRMEQQTGYQSFYYGNFDDDHRHWRTYPAWPRYGTQYVAVRGRLSILTEAYAYASYRDRVLATRSFVLNCLQLAAERKAAIRDMLQNVRSRWVDADLNDSEPAQIALQSRVEPLDRRFTALGYDESDLDPDAPRGTLPVRTQDYEDVEFVGVEQPTLAVERPFAYLIPERLSSVIANLRQHGIKLEILREDVELDVEQYRIDQATRAEREFQRHRTMKLSVTAQRKPVRFEAGTVVVPTAQDLGRLTMLLLEPASQDGLATWNFFDDDVSPAAVFPIARLMKPAPLLVIDHAELHPAVKTTNREPITYETLYGEQPPNFSGSPVSKFRWMPEGEHYLLFRNDNWHKIHAATGRSVPFLDRERLHRLLEGLPGIDEEQARRMTRDLNLDQARTASLWEHDGNLYFARLDGSLAHRLTDSSKADELATLSPDGKHAAFIRDYDLYVVDTTTGRHLRRMTEGGNATLRHGKADWVYFEEIYNRSWKSYRWSPDSLQIAFQEFDDSPVRDFVVLDHIPHRLDVETERYPKAGDPIPHVRLGFVRRDGGPVRWITLDGYSDGDVIITRYGWLPDSKRLFIFVQDRAQRWLDFLVAGPDTSQVQRLFREQTAAWVNDPGDPEFLQDESIILRSDRDGWRHLYRFESDGRREIQLTHGEWEVRQVHEIDEQAGWAYFSGTRDSHLESHLYRVRLDGTGLVRLTTESGQHRVDLAPNGRYFIDRRSDLQSPTQIALFAGDGQSLRTLDTNPVPDLEKFQRGKTELVELKMRDGFALAGIFVKPHDFDPQRKYPIWLSTYSGPHAFTVSNDWRAGRAFDHLLAQLGVIVFHFDPRSASGRGPNSSWTAYRQLGVQELQDLEDAADWLAGQPFVDGTRIGIGGYSYGGFMAAFALTHSTKFCAGFAGAPVTDWRNYDSFYTERYMDTPQENPDGYERTSVVNAAKNLHGRLLIVHGAMDDNVHLQNTLQLSQELQKADKDFELMIYPSSRHGIHGKHFRRLRFDFIRRAMLK